MGIVDQGEVEDQAVEPNNTNNDSLNAEESETDAESYQGPVTRSRAKSSKTLLKANILMDKYFDTSEKEELEDTKSMCILQ